MRTVQQMPGVRVDDEARHTLFEKLVKTKVPALVSNSFQHGNTPQALGEEVAFIKSLNAACEVYIGACRSVSDVEVAAGGRIATAVIPVFGASAPA